MRIWTTILLVLFLAKVGSAQTEKPNEFTEETTITNANFEFYSQKGDSTRRASAYNVKKYMVPDINPTAIATAPSPTGNVSNLMSFVTKNDSIWYVDANGDAFLLKDPNLSGYWNTYFQNSIDSLFEVVLDSTLTVSDDLYIGDSTFVYNPNTTNYYYQRNWVYVTDFGATPGDGTDDADAFEDAIDFLVADSTYNTLILPPGRYNFSRGLSYTGLTDGINLIGEDGAEIFTDTLFSFTLSLRGNEITSVTLSQERFRGQDTVYVSSTAGIDTTMGFWMQSDFNVVPGSSWGYTESDMHRIYQIVDDTTIVLAAPLNFNYDPVGETVSIRIASMVDVGIENIDFVTDYYQPTVGSDMLILRSVRARVTDCDFIAPAVGRTADLLTFSQSIGSVVERCRFRGSRYAMVFNTCRDVSVRDSYVEHSRHAVIPTTFCDGVYVYNLVGKNNESTIESHPSFNIFYENVRAWDIKYPNCRAFGINIKDAHIILEDSTYTETYAYWFPPGAIVAAEYEFLYGEYDAYFEDVEWTTWDGGRFNGLTVHDCRNLTVINCKTHSVGTYGVAIEKMTVINSEVGHLEMRGSGTRLLVTGTIFDGSLNPTVFDGSATTDVIRQIPGDGASFDVSGQAIFRDCWFKNYNDTVNYVIGTMTANDRVMFDNCSFEGFKGFVRSPTGAGFQDFRLINSRLYDFTDSLQYEFTRTMVDTRGTWFEDIGSVGYIHYQGDTLQNVLVAQVSDISHRRYNMPHVTLVDTDQDTIIAPTHYQLKYQNDNQVRITFRTAYNNVRVMINAVWLLAIPLYRRRKRKIIHNINQTTNGEVRN